MSSARISRLSLVALGAATLLAWGAPTHAGAQAVVTAHPVGLTLKLVTQMTTGGGELKPDKFTVNTNDIFEACIGDPPTKTQGIYLFIDCANPDNNMIAAIETQPLTLLREIGSVDFDDNPNLFVQTTKDGGATLKAATVPADVEIDCGVSAQLEVRGIVDLTYKALGADICVDTAKVKAVGSGFSTLAGGDFIVDDGSSLQAKKTVGGISTFPPEP